MRSSNLVTAVLMVFLSGCFSYKSIQEINMRSKFSKPLWASRNESGLQRVKPLQCVYVRANLADINLGISQTQLESLNYCEVEIIKEMQGLSSKVLPPEVLKLFKAEIQKSMQIKDIYFESIADLSYKTSTYRVFVLISMTGANYEALKNKVSMSTTGR